MFEFIANHNLVGFLGFTWVSQIMSAIIASERCFCVVSPLRSQSVLSTRTMAVIIVVVYIVVPGLFFLVAFRYRLVCVYEPTTGVYFKMLDGGAFYYKHKVIILMTSDHFPVRQLAVLFFWNSFPAILSVYFLFAYFASRIILLLLNNDNRDDVGFCGYHDSARFI